MAVTYTDTRLPSIRLDALKTPLSINALALVVPADGKPTPVTAADFSPAPPAVKNGHRVSVVAKTAIPKQVLAVARKAGVVLEGRGPADRPAAARPGPAAALSDHQAFSHPDVGGKFTVFALFYGPETYYDMHRQCLESIVRTVPASRLDLRVGSNELNQKSLAMLNDFATQGVISKHYYHADNRTKYPVMREMFYDPEHPITTKWIIWFDDDTIADKSANWLTLLSQAIIQYHRKDKAHMFGTKFVWSLQPGQREWYASRPWWHNRPWRGQNGKPAPNGNKILFCAGGWWALTHEAMVACDIPDPALTHNKGDVAIGEQLWQGGFNIKAFNTKKQFINTSSVPRRGITQPAAGTLAWQRDPHAIIRHH